jgi:hypothetical protein
MEVDVGVETLRPFRFGRNRRCADDDNNDIDKAYQGQLSDFANEFSTSTGFGSR